MKLLTSLVLATVVAIVSAKNTNSSLSTEVSSADGATTTGSINDTSLDTAASTSNDILVGASSSSTSSGSTDIDAGDSDKGDSYVGSNEEDYSIEYASMSGDESNANGVDSSSASETKNSFTDTSGSDASSSSSTDRSSGTVSVAFYTSVTAATVTMVVAVLL